MKLSDIPNITQAAQDLIKAQQTEIQQLRVMLYRAYLKHGSEIQGGSVTPLPRNQYFDTERENDSVRLVIIDSKETGIKSRGEEAEEMYFKLMP